MGESFGGLGEDQCMLLCPQRLASPQAGVPLPCTVAALAVKGTHFLVFTQ